MPKKSSRDSAEARKRRSSSAKDSRNQSSDDVLLPPTPTASHLVASNPFDDPPPTNTMTNPNTFQGPPAHMLMHSPMRMPGVPSNHAPKGAMPDWKPNWPAPIRGPQYEAIGSPQWRAPVIQGTNYPNPNIPHPEFSRSGGMGLGAHPLQYPPPSHREVPNFGPANSFATPQPHHLGPMKPRRSEKLPKSESNFLQTKSRKKGKNTDSQSATKPVVPRVEENWIQTSSSPGSKTHSSPPVIESVPPHSIPPPYPTTCSQCMKEIKHLSEDGICCLASCKNWYHRSCTGLTLAAYELLKGEELALWACDNCLYVKEIGSVRLRNSSDSPSAGNSVPLLPTKA